MDTKKKYLTVLLIFCVSIALFFVLILLRRIHVEQFDITFLLPAIAYYILTILLLRRYGNKLSKTLIILSALAGATVVEIPLRIIDFHETLLSFPDFIGKIIAIMAALLTFVCRKTSWKVVVACLYFSFCIWYAFFGYIYYFRIISWGTFTGKVDEHVEVLFTPFNDEGTEIDLKDIEAEYILLDAWNSGCNVCFKNSLRYKLFTTNSRRTTG